MNKPICAVVGIGPGNGAAFARAFHAAGYQLALLSRSTDLSQQIARSQDDTHAYACDAADPDSIAAAFENIRAQQGENIDALIYNAGGGSWNSALETSVEEFERSWRINALGGFVASKEVLPGMIERGSGNIVFIGATASRRGGKSTTGFASAKAAQRNLAESLAKQYWPEGVHVSLMIIDGQIDPGSKSGNSRPQRLAPDDIASMALSLTQQPESAWSFEFEARPNQEPWS